MNQEQSRIKREDKKALKRFWIICVVSFLGGGLLGIGMGLAKIFITGDFMTVTEKVFNQTILFDIPVITLLVTAAVIVLYRRSRRAFASWDGEEETLIDRIDRWLSYGLWLISMNTVWNFFVYAAALCTGIWDQFDQYELRTVLILTAEFVAVLFLNIRQQQKIVNLEKEINPEKYGSVYDTKFQKKWMESCDEAEQLAIYKCGYKAYRAVQYTCLGLWVLCIFAGFFTDIGILPVLVITVIWGVLVSVYMFEAIRLSKK